MENVSIVPRKKRQIFLIENEKLDAYDVTTKINTFLNYLCLSGITRNVKEEIACAKLTIQFVLMVAVISVLTLTCLVARFYFTYWKEPWNQRAYTELFLSILSVVFSISIFITSYSVNVEDHRQYFQNYRTIDKILNLDFVDNYLNESRNVNKLFFTGFVFGNVMKLIIEPLLACVSYSLMEFVPNINDLITINIHFTIILYVSVKLVILQKRFAVFEQKILYLTKNMKEDVTLIVTKYKECYLLFYKQCYLMNKMHGWQEMMECAFLLLCLTRFMYSVVVSGLTGYKFAAFVAIALMRLVIDGGLMIYLVTIIEQIMADRQRTCIHLEEALIQPLDLQGKENVSSLLEHIRRQPIVFTACNFFVLDYTMLQGMFSATVSYIIILTQMKL